MELYNLRTDPNEVMNVYSDPAYTEIVDCLKIELAELRRELNEEDEGFPHLQEIID